MCCGCKNICVYPCKDGSYNLITTLRDNCFHCILSSFRLLESLHFFVFLFFCFIFKPRSSKHFLLSSPSLPFVYKPRLQTLYKTSPSLYPSVVVNEYGTATLPCRREYKASSWTKRRNDLCRKSKSKLTPRPRSSFSLLSRCA